MQRGTGGISLSGLLAFFGPLALYIATLSPGVDFWDIGEMQTVPYLLGIAHPTGFPLFVLLGFAFSHVVPVGSVAWRMSLMCALASATAAFALYAFVRSLCADARIAVATAFVFAIGSIAWTHAIRADVHDLALATIGLSLAAALRAGQTHSPRALAFGALALGCGLATHPIAVLAVPSALLLAWPALVRANAVALLRTAACALVPLLAYGYIPWRSAYVEAHGLDPGIALGIHGGAIFDSGAPATLGAFQRYVTGADFHTARAVATAFSLPGLARAGTFARASVYREYGLVVLAFALVGFVVLVLRQPRVALALGLVAFGCAAFVANFTAESDVARYALPGLWATAACAGFGAAWLATSLFERSAERARAFATGVLLVAMLPGIATAASDVGKSKAIDDATALGPVLARLTADGSLVVASWNFATPLFYETYVARTLGGRQIVSGWPHDFPGRYDAWRRHFKHVYFVLAISYDVTPFATPLAASGRWQLSELKS